MVEDKIFINPVNMRMRWEDSTNMIIPWKKVFNIIYNTTLDLSIHIIQTQIIYTFLSTQKRLSMCGLERTSFCRFSKDDEESRS